MPVNKSHPDEQLVEEIDQKPMSDSPSAGSNQLLEVEQKCIPDCDGMDEAAIVNHAGSSSTVETLESSGQSEPGASTSDALPAPSAEPMQLLNLGEHCVREMCDRMDLDTLCRFADSSNKIAIIARDSFASRKLTTLKHYGRPPMSYHPVPEQKIRNDGHVIKINIWFSDSFARLLRHFGDFLTELTLDNQFNITRLHLSREACDLVAQHCAGTLKVLKLGGIPDFNPDCVHVQRLTENIEELELRFLKYFVEFLTPEERVKNGLGPVTEKFCKLTFPRLERIVLYSPVHATFIRRHANLTEIELSPDYEFDERMVDAIVQAPNLKKLSFGLFSSREPQFRLLEEMPPLKSLQITYSREVSWFFENVICFAAIMRQNAALVASLEEFVIKGEFDFAAELQNLPAFRSLRSLVLYEGPLFSLYGADVAEHIRYFVEHSQSDRLELISIHYTVQLNQFDFDALHAWCRGRNIDLKCTPLLDGFQDNDSENGDYNNEAYFGNVEDEV